MPWVYNAYTSASMMLVVIAAAEIGITVTTVTLDQVWLAELEVLMCVGCIKQRAALRGLGHLLCKPCSTCSMGQQNISGSIYFNRPNDTSISLKRNVKVKWFPLERKTLVVWMGRFVTAHKWRGVWRFWVSWLYFSTPLKQISKVM